MSEKLKVIHLFSGVGAPERALTRLKILFEIVGYSEIDKYAIQAYKALNGDVSLIERLPRTNLLVYGSPCQDFSVAGKQRGLIDSEGKQTRSGLLLEVDRLLQVAKDNKELPEYLVMENVKNLVSKKFKPDFEKWLIRLEELGYTNYWKVLNAKDFGVPQNRERVFVVSIRKDLAKGYIFPDGIPLKKTLADILEKEVAEKYYLSETCVKGFIKHNNNHLRKGTGFLWQPKIPQDSIANCLRANGALSPTDNTIIEPIIVRSVGRNPEKPSDRSVGAPTEQRLEPNSKGIANTLTTVQKDNLVLEPRVIQFEGNLYPNSGNPQAGRVYNTLGISPSLDTMQGGNRQPKVLEDFRVRRLTPRECYRLMAFTDQEFDAISATGLSNSQLYKIAGNSIVVNCLVAIFFQLFYKK